MPLKTISTGRGLMGGGTYADKVRGFGPIAYWPLWEANGTVAQCLTNPAMNGTYSSAVNTWPVGPGIGDGNTAPFFDGANDFVNVFSATFQGAFNGSEGTMACWARVANAGVWTDGAARRTHQFAVDAANRQRNGKTLANILFWDYTAGGVNEFPSLAATPTAWFHMAASWSKIANTFQVYYNGAPQTPWIALGNWAGILAANLTCIGSDDTTPTNPWHGWIAHMAVWNRPLTAATISALAAVS